MLLLNVHGEVYIGFKKSELFKFQVLFCLWIHFANHVKGQDITHYSWIPPPSPPVIPLTSTSHIQQPSLPVIVSNYPATSFACGGVISISPGIHSYLISPRYPDAYPPNIQCKWEVKAPFGSRISFFFEYLMLPSNDLLGCSGDKLEIVDIHQTERYCLYKYGGIYLSVASTVSVHFISDRIREDFPARFRIRLEAMSNWCGGELTNLSGEIESPNYPQTYSTNVVCAWRIKGPVKSQIRFSCQNQFWLEPNSDCSKDFLAVSLSDDESLKTSTRYCGINGPNAILSNTNVMTLLFYSNTQFTFRGFRCRYSILVLSGEYSYANFHTALTSGVSQNAVTTATTFPMSFASSFAQLSSSPSSTKVFNPPCDCGRANKMSVREARIVGGTQTAINAYPWVVAIFKRDGRQYCAGSLINELYILTASHCVARLSATDIYISLGDHDLDIVEETRSLMVKIRRIIVHPGYRSTPVETDDIALLELVQPITLSASVRPVCLPPPELDTRGQTPTVVGWGKLSEAGLSTSVLREIALPIQPNTECKKAYGFSVVTDNMICAGHLDGTKDACQGDSGGPMMVIRQLRWYMIGLVSYGFGCARRDFPGVYTRIDRYLDWIRENTEISNVCSSIPRPIRSDTSQQQRQQESQNNKLRNRYEWLWNYKLKNDQFFTWNRPSPKSGDAGEITENNVTSNTNLIRIPR